MLIREWKRRRNNPEVFLSKPRSWPKIIVVPGIFAIVLSLNSVFAATGQTLLESSSQGITCPSEVEWEIIHLLNQERADQNLPPLIIDMRLMDAARRHTHDMVVNDFVSHTGSDGSSAFDRIADSGYSMRYAGENIAAGYRTAEAAVYGWMNSDGHRSNILHASYEHIGLGYVYDENATYGHYWTTDFGSTNGEVQPLPLVCWPSVDPTPTQTAEPGVTFMDVPPDHPYYEIIEALYQAGYTSGCSMDPLMYCPERTMNRAESAVYVERGLHGSEFDPVDPVEIVFADVALDSWYSDWAHGLWNDSFTSGCVTNPLKFCPDQEHTRAEATIFYLRMLYGADYEPPAAKGYFADVVGGIWYARWVDAAYDAGIAEPCATEPELRYCPEDPLTRAVAAYMMVQAKDLDLP